MTKDEALKLASQYVHNLATNATYELVILDEHTIERDFGWIFFYDSSQHVETGSMRDVIAGNAPIIVSKIDGQIHVTGTALPIEKYIANFEQYGSPYPPNHGE